MVRDAVVLDPGVGVVEAVGKAPYMSFPVADEKVEIVCSISLREICWIRSSLGERWDGKEHAEQEQREKCGLAGFHRTVPQDGDRTSSPGFR